MPSASYAVTTNPPGGEKKKRLSRLKKGAPPIPGKKEGGDPVGRGSQAETGSTKLTYKRTRQRGDSLRKKRKGSLRLPVGDVGAPF